MPGVRETNPVVAVLSSDWHISHKPPLARSVEKDWYAVMNRVIGQVFAVQDKYSVPLVIAGDLFDSPNQPAEVVNWLMAGMAGMGRGTYSIYAIPGQHDLPFHSYADRRKSAYWTLVEASRIKNLAPGKPAEFANVRLWGFPFGKGIKPLKKSHSLCLDVAVCHSYVWYGKAVYDGALKEHEANRAAVWVRDYDVGVFGDNHVHFQYPANPKIRPCVWNCGTLMRRKQDERNLQPSVGLLREDGTITRHKLDCSQDKFLEPDEAVGKTLANGDGRMDSFIEELSNLGESAVNFADAVKRIMDGQKVPAGVRAAVLRCLEDRRQ